MLANRKEFLCVLLAILGSAIAGFPSDIIRCQHGDGACLVKSVQHAITTYAKSGLRELNLIPFDPLHVKSLVLSKNPASPVSVELKFKDIDFIGLQNTKVLKVTGFDVDPEGKTNELEVFIPSLVIRGPYSVDGKVLLLPITGKGNSEIRVDKVHLRALLKSKAVQKDGKVYREISGVKIIIHPEHASYHLEGLFNGDKTLSDSMHQVLNENWKEVITELLPQFSEAISLVLKHIVNGVFSKYPYADFFV